jgi:hypothetical protein
MNLNSHIIKFSGSAELSGPLEIATRYAIGAEVAITDERKVDLENGTFDLEYKARLVRAQVHTKEGRLDTKDKTHESVKTRRIIMAMKNEYRPDMDDEEWYVMVQKGIRAKMPEIINQILT